MAGVQGAGGVRVNSGGNWGGRRVEKWGVLRYRIEGKGRGSAWKVEGVHSGGTWIDMYVQRGEGESSQKKGEGRA